MSHGFSNTNSTDGIRKRQLFTTTLLHLIWSGYEPIFIDESGFNTHFHPSRGYAIRNRRVRIKFVGQKSKNRTLLAAVSTKEVIGYKLICGGVKGAEFYVYIADLLEDIEFTYKKYVLICDNA